MGIELAAGATLAEITGSMKMVAEGVKTTFAAMDLARPVRRRDADHGADVRHPDAASGRREVAIRELMERSLKGE